MVEIKPGLRVAASIHAAERALERIPLLRGAHRDQASYWVEQSAGRALRDGRKALRCPRWCVREEEEGLRRRGKARREGTARFVWNEDETAVFLVRRVNDARYPGDEVWLVQTTLAPEGDVRLPSAVA